MVSLKHTSFQIAVAAVVAASPGLQAVGPERPVPADPAARAAEGPNRWATHFESSAALVDHGPWTTFLQATTLEERGVTRVAFSALTGDHREFLDGYINWLATLKPSEWDRTEQLAYWINLHNALTVRVLADSGGRGTVDRVRQFPVASSGPFAQPVVTVEGQPLSIDAIVQEVLRPNFSDTPFHYGLFTGAKGAPKLQRTAYEGATVIASLEDQAREYVNGHGVRVTRNGVQLSSLYEWYAADFGGSDEAVLRHLGSYANDRLKADLQMRGTIESYRYDLDVASIIPRRFDHFNTPGDRSLGLGDGSQSEGGGS